MTWSLRPFGALAFVACLGPVLAQPGTVDDGYLPPVFTNTDNIAGVVALPDGKLLVYGNLASTNAGQVGLIRLLDNGALDPAFQPELPAQAAVTNCLPLANGGLLVALGQGGLIRLNPDGSADPTLVLPTPFSTFGYQSFAEQPDGKLLLGGTFWANGYRRFVRILPDGSFDPSFVPGVGPEGLTGWVASIALQPDGKILLGGGMSGVNGAPSSGLCRLNADGTQDLSFTLTPGTESLGYGASLTQLTVLPDGRILTAGNFHTMNGVARSNMARLNGDGTLDATFAIGTGFTAPGPPYSNYNSQVNAFAVQADGRILVAGRFTVFNGLPCPPLVRLNSDGTLDNGFDIGTVFLERVSSIGLQPDGKVIATGQFNGTGPYNHLVRLENCFAGAVCDDGLAYTVNDVLDAACQCSGTPQCAPSQLTSTADPLVSCGATGLRLDGTSTLYATPVPGANKYQFRFINVPGQPACARNIATTTRSLQLVQWATNPLKKGRSYRVTVRASFDNGATWCDAGGSCTIGIANYGSSANRSAIADEGGNEAGMRLFPVPYTAGPLTLNAFGLAADGALEVRVMNATGQEVGFTRYHAMGEQVTLPVPVDQVLMPGLYFVELRTGEQRLVERLIVQ